MENALMYRSGSVLEVGGCGVFIAGESNTGKTTLAYALTKRGHVFVADDVVGIEFVGDKVVAWSPPQNTGQVFFSGNHQATHLKEIFSQARIKSKTTLFLYYELFDSVNKNNQLSKILGLCPLKSRLRSLPLYYKNLNDRIDFIESSVFQYSQQKNQLRT